MWLGIPLVRFATRAHAGEQTPLSLPAKAILTGRLRSKHMPAGPEPLGLAYFAAVKFAGYTAAASFIRRRIPDSSASPWLVGGVRTIIGLGAGIGAAYTASQLGILRPEVGFYALLAPIRMCEWIFLLAVFFRRNWTWPRSLKLAALGTVWSYVLDIPAILAVFVIPGGAWIC
jgi:hypothetical protein